MALSLVRACHPLPSLAVTAIAAGLAAGAGRSAGAVALVAAAILFGQLSVGWLDDLRDAPRDALAGRSEKPVATGELAPSIVRGGVLVAAVGAVLLSLPFGLPATAVHLTALISAWSYDLGVKATAFSVMPYAVSFGLLPAFVTLGLSGAPLPPWWLMAGAASLGCAAHFVNALPDLTRDVSVGIRGLPHRLGVAWSGLASSAFVLLTSVLLTFGPPGTPAPAGLAAVPLAAVVLGIGLVRNRQPHSRAAFRAVLLVALLDVALLIHIGLIPE